MNVDEERPVSSLGVAQFLLERVRPTRIVSGPGPSVLRLGPRVSQLEQLDRLVVDVDLEGADNCVVVRCLEAEQTGSVSRGEGRDDVAFLH